MTTDTLLVLLIVVLAAFFVIRRFVRQARSSEVSCGCGGGCSGCSSTRGDIAERGAASGHGCCCSGGDCGDAPAKGEPAPGDKH